jgi:hypothetical protein
MQKAAPIVPNIPFVQLQSVKSELGGEAAHRAVDGGAYEFETG